MYIVNYYTHGSLICCGNLFYYHHVLSVISAPPQIADFSKDPTVKWKVVQKVSAMRKTAGSFRKSILANCNKVQLLQKLGFDDTLSSRIVKFGDHPLFDGMPSQNAENRTHCRECQPKRCRFC